MITFKSIQCAQCGTERIYSFKFCPKCGDNLPEKPGISLKRWLKENPESYIKDYFQLFASPDPSSYGKRPSQRS